MNVLKIKSKRDGYRRCGRGFSAVKETVIPLDELTEDEIATLKADGGLVVVESAAGEDSSADAGEDHQAALAEAAQKQAAAEHAAAVAGKRIAELEAELQKQAKAHDGVLKARDDEKSAADKRIAELEAELAAAKTSAGEASGRTKTR